MLPIFFLFCSLLNTAQQEWAWRIFPESNFKVLAPFTMEHKSTEVPTEAEPIIYHQYYGGSLQDTSFHLALVIDHYQLTQQEMGGDDEYLREFFGVTVDQILKSVGGSLIYMDFTGHSDREVCVWRATYQEGKGVLRGHLVIAGDKYYGLQAFGLAEEKPDAMMLKFFDSFQIINP
jgi:hypothetical protein